MHTVFGQSTAQLRFDWGLAGALALTGQPIGSERPGTTERPGETEQPGRIEQSGTTEQPGTTERPGETEQPGTTEQHGAIEESGTAVVVVDVLSFCTAVSVATDLGIETFPYRWGDNRAAEFADTHGAQLAAGRRRDGVSLSPASIRAWAEARSPHHGAGGQPPSDADRPTPVRARLVLPSPNGSTICCTLSDRGSPVLAGSLRSAAVIADWVARGFAAGRLRAVAVVAAGERWPDDTPRPAVEDLWGAGAVLDRLHRMAPELAMSAEARTAAAAFAAVEPELTRHLLNCASGRELAEAGFVEDVAIAAELDAGLTAPLLDRGRFRPA